MSWVDVARAASIVLVVSYHTGVAAVFDLLPRQITDAGEWWRTANLLLVPLRMPLFFVVAGMLAVGALARPWPAVRGPRVTNLLWAYVLWSVVFALTAWPRYAPDDPWGYLRGGLQNIVLFASPYWFIAVLPVFFLVTRWGRNRPWILLALLFLAYLASPALESWVKTFGPEFMMAAAGVRRLTEFGVWFAAGFVLSDRLRGFGAAPRPLVAVIAVAASGPLCYAAVMAGLDPGARRLALLAASCASVTAVLALSTMLGRFAPAAALGRVVGSRTLVIYLVHPLVLNVVVVLSRWALDRGEWERSAAADLLLVPTVIALCVVVALLVKAAADRIGADWLFEVPRRLRGRGDGPAARRPGSRRT
ncbi:acyltransferase family protein [Brachybacterium sp. AOP43-C2-M15]|uniref:acyltransferase family protein n=1 Tax=Brachybacterium sp. AOP43-C2-M15 TaxID=3457661 RepID=UPI004033BFD0